MAHEFRYQRRVQFAETDMAGIVHFTAFLRYAEEAEHAFYRSLGLSVHAPGDATALGFPRVAARCEYLAPAKFEDVLEVHLWVRKKGSRSLVYQFTIERLAVAAAMAAATVLAKGEMAVVCCRTLPGHRVEAARLPPAFAERLEEAPYAGLELR